MRKLEIIGLAIVAATAFGVWSASTVAQSRVGKADVRAASAPISPHAIMVKLGSSLPSEYFRATCNSPSPPNASPRRRCDDRAPLLLDYPWGLLAFVAIAVLYGLR
jgi:hypothetical protein